MISYPLPGTRRYESVANKPEIRLRTYEDMIANFTEASFAEDGIEIVKGSANREQRQRRVWLRSQFRSKDAVCATRTIRGDARSDA
jgi:hypothetical protein